MAVDGSVGGNGIFATAITNNDNVMGLSAMVFIVDFFVLQWWSILVAEMAVVVIGGFTEGASWRNPSIRGRISQPGEAPLGLSGIKKDKSDWGCKASPTLDKLDFYGDGPYTVLT